MALAPAFAIGIIMREVPEAEGVEVRCHTIRHWGHGHAWHARHAWHAWHAWHSIPRHERWWPARHERGTRRRGIHGVPRKHGSLWLHLCGYLLMWLHLEGAGYQLPSRHLTLTGSGRVPCRFTAK